MVFQRSQSYSLVLFASCQQIHGPSSQLEIQDFICKVSYLIIMCIKYSHQMPIYTHAYIQYIHICISLQHSVFKWIWCKSSFPRFRIPFKVLLPLIAAHFLWKSDEIISEVCALRDPRSFPQRLHLALGRTDVSSLIFQMRPLGHRVHQLLQKLQRVVQRLWPHPWSQCELNWVHSKVNGQGS